MRTEGPLAVYTVTLVPARLNARLSEMTQAHWVSLHLSPHAGRANVGARRRLQRQRERLRTRVARGGPGHSGGRAVALAPPPPSGLTRPWTHPTMQGTREGPSGAAGARPLPASAPLEPPTRGRRAHCRRPRPLAVAPLAVAPLAVTPPDRAPGQGRWRCRRALPQALALLLAVPLAPDRWPSCRRRRPPSSRTPA